MSNVLALRFEERRLAALVELLPELDQLPPQALPFDQTIGRKPHLIGREWLRDIVDGPACDGVQGALDGRKYRDDNDAAVG